MTQNTPTKTIEESPVYIDEVEMFNPAAPEIERLREELSAERDARLRLAAEYENYRRRTKQESAQAADRGKRELFEQLVSIADDLDLAAANADESSEALAEGLQLIHRRFHGVLEADGVQTFESTGEKFDPERHEAFEVAFGTDNEPGTVTREIRRGYFWKGKLLRPALVEVAQ